MKKLLTISFLLCFFGTITSYAQLPGYYFYKTLTIQASQVAGTGSHTDFPILISETDADLAHLSFGGDVQNLNGFDIVFTQADGVTLLEHQIEKYDETNGEYDAWVKIPSLSSTINTEIRMYYGNGQVSADPSTDNVWDANFAAVYHLTDDFLDKTSNNNNLTNNGSSNHGSGQVAKCRKLSPTEYIQAPNSGSIAITGNVTVSCWVDVNTLQAGAYDNNLISHGGLADLAVDNHLYYLNIRDDGRLSFLWEYLVGFDEIVVSANSIVIPPSGFTHISASRNVSTNEVTFYQDGVPLDVTPTSYANDPTGGLLGVLRLGSNLQFPAFDLDGDIDEVRISNIQRSDDWILTDFNTVNDPSTFYTKGAEVKLFGIWEWMDTGSTVNEEWGNDIAVDTINQFVYTAGTLTDRNAFGIGAARVNGGTDNGFKDGFLAQHDFAGNLNWIVPLGGDNDDEATGVAIDAAGNPYVTGYFTGYIVAHSSDLSTNFPGGAGGNEDIFIAKYSPAGILDWIQTEGGSGNDRAHAIDITSGAVYMAGVYDNSAIFGSISSETTNNTTRNTFLSKHKLSDGDAEWLMEVKSEGNDVNPSQTIQNSSMNIVAFKDSIYVVGYMGGITLRFVEGDGTLLASPILNDANASGNDIFIYAADTSGSLVWAQKIDNIDSPHQLGFGISADCNGVYLAGLAHDGAIFPGPDVISTTNHDKPFLSKFQHGDGTEVWLKEFGNSTTNHTNIFHDIKADGYGNLFVCGTVQDAISNADTSFVANVDQSVAVLKYTNDGTFQWAEQSVGSTDDKAYALDTYQKDNVFMTGEYSDNFQMASVIVPATTNDRNFFMSKMNTLGNGTLLECCSGLQIDICQGDTTVTADPSCNHTLGDYTGLVTATDVCGGGLTFTQAPLSGTVLTSGTHLISVYVEDIEGNTDSCQFNLIIEADVNPIIAECGNIFVNQTTGGGGNTSSSFSCSPVATPGQDVYYQVTVPTGNHFLYVNIDNVTDSNDDTLHTFWVGSACPLGGSCIESYSYDIANQHFVTNNSNTETFLATGPGTYYFVIDSEVDSIQSYDIWFDCLTSGIEYDTTDCSGNDSNKDGLIPFVNGSSAILDIKPCESVNICHDLIINNVNDFEWVDSVEMKLGPCFENINTATLTPDLPTLNTGFYDTNGEWEANYSVGSNTIMWEFDHSSANPWGDGNSGNYSCNSYSFCFDADITATCLESDSTQITIGIWDDAIPVGFTVGGFDSEISSDFNLLPPDDAGWSYSATSICQGDSDPAPTITGTVGGSFSSTAGLEWANQTNGIIDLMGSTPGAYDITYTVGLCMIDSVFSVTIVAEDDPFFDYSSTSFCAGDSDPSPTNVATAGGNYTATPGLEWADQSNGIIDLSDTPPNTYTVTYTTTGTCPNSTTFDVTINSEVDPTFNYSGIEFCSNGTNELPSLIQNPGGTFSSSPAGLNIDGTSGEVTPSSSSVNDYKIYYTTNGICPNIDSVNFNINPIAISTFNYDQTQYCQNESDPSAMNVLTGGGTFSSDVNVIWNPQSNGTVDLSASSAGLHTITYTTDGSACPSSSTFDITINASDDPFFDYPQNLYCENEIDPDATNITTAGGTFSSITGLSILDDATGLIDLDASPLGTTHTIKYLTAGTCPDSTTFDITINALEDPFFDYSQSNYCQNEVNPAATNIALAGGTFATSVGLIWLDENTGLIDLENSTEGTYIIEYTTPGPNCKQTHTFDLTILTFKEATIEYSASEYCITEGNQLPISDTSVNGVFSSTNGNLIVDSSSGEINFDLSNYNNPYEIKYVIQGNCADSATTLITIFELPLADAGEDQILDNIDFTVTEGLSTPFVSEWTILNGGGNISDINNVITDISDLNSGENLFELRVQNGSCPIAKDSLLITVNDLWIPNLVSPNGDGKNETFEIKGIENSINQVQIFNRWGQTVLDQENYLNDWDGTNADGSKLEDDTYFYIITIDTLTYKGYLVLKR